MTKMKIGSMTRTSFVNLVTRPVANPHTTPMQVPPTATTKKEARPARKSVYTRLEGPISLWNKENLLNDFQFCRVFEMYNLHYKSVQSFVLKSMLSYALTPT